MWCVRVCACVRTTHAHAHVHTTPFSPPTSQLGSTTRASRLYPVRRNTVVHGEVLVIRKLVVAGIVSAEKSYIDGLCVMKEVSRESCGVKRGFFFLFKKAWGLREGLNKKG